MEELKAIEVNPIPPVGRDEIKKTAMLTANQSEDPNWMKVRKNRLTASLFGKILRVMSTHNEHEKKSLISFIKGEDKRYGMYYPAIVWGREHEKEAIKAYESMKNYTVRPTGFWLFANNIMGASPDGIVFARGEHANEPIGIVEVKCPYSIRNLSFSDPEYKKHHLPYLDLDLKLIEMHEYYHQIQGELYATDAPWCDFVVWTPKDMHIERIYPDETWRRTEIPRLISFFVESVLTVKLQLFNF